MKTNIRMQRRANLIDCLSTALRHAEAFGTCALDCMPAGRFGHQYEYNPIAADEDLKHYATAAFHAAALAVGLIEDLAR
jgi:hypothetical protein